MSTYVVLLHHPVTNRRGEVVTTAVTNIDIHDISRSCRTYGVRTFYIVTPIIEQQGVVGRILEHWKGERAREWHPDRVEAVDRVRVVPSFEEVLQKIQEIEGERPEVVLTDARRVAGDMSLISWGNYRQELQSKKGPVVLILGTGWGVSDAFYPHVNRVLDPIYGPRPEEGEGYNHLSVRAAAAIMLDRLFGE